jgi:hypothetical protein
LESILRLLKSLKISSLEGGRREAGEAGLQVERAGRRSGGCTASKRGLKTRLLEEAARQAER